MTALVTDNLPLLAGAPNGISRLRSLILDLAIRGKLVEQNPVDEAADALVRRIANARLEATSRHRPKSNTVSTAVKADAQPYVLPAGWLWTNLASIAQVNPRNSADDDIPVSFVPMAQIGATFDAGHGQEVRKWGEVKQGFTHFAEGDIAVAKITPCFENSKACVFSALTNGLGAGTTELHVVRPFAGTLAPRYVLAYLKSPWFLLVGETRMTGTAGQKRLPKDFVEQHPFPLPPLSEQHRIASKVDELMALCDRLEAQQADAEAAHAQLVQALLASLTQARDAADFRVSWQQLAEHFHTLFTTEDSVDALRSSILHLAADGKLVFGLNDTPRLPIGQLLVSDTLNGCSRKPSENPGGTPILRISAGTGSADLYVDETDHKWVEISDSEREKFRLLPNDLLACRFNGNLHYVGAFALYRGVAGVEQVFPDKLIRFRVDEQVVLPNYIRFVMNAVPTRLQIESFCATTVGNIGISATNLKTVKVRVPSLEEQHRIVAKVTELLRLCDQLKQGLAAARQSHEHLATVLVEQAAA